MAGGGSSDGEFGLQIAPMLDILFVLLLFFMVSAGSQKHEASIVTQLPGGSTEPGKSTPVQITIDANGQVSVNEGACDTPDTSQLKETIARLKQIISGNADQPVVITPQASTRQQRVVDVLNACTAAGVKNLAFSASASP